MTRRIGTARKKTRKIMSVAKTLKGKLAPSRFLQRLNPGEKVVFTAAPSVHKGMYYRRYHGRTGVVKSAKGNACEVSIKDNGKTKTIVVNPVHLTKVQNGTKNNK